MAKQKMITGTVVQEGRFLKVFDDSGRDVSNQVERSLRRKALEQGIGLVFDVDSNTWMLSSAIAEMAKDTPRELTPEEKRRQFIMESPSLRPEHLIMSDLKWKYLIRSAIAGENIMMTGAAGSGKTMAAKYLVEALKRPDFYFNLGATQDPRSTLIGNTHFNKEDGTYFAESIFVKAIQTPNAVILLDEISRAHPEAWNILMTVLDKGQRYLRLDEKDNCPTIKVAEGVCFIATANIGNEYTSTRVMDRALMDRFTIIEMDILNADQEQHLLQLKYPKLSSKLLRSIAEIREKTANDLKSASPKLSTALSTRAAVAIAGLCNDGFSLAEAAEVAIYPFFSADGGVDSERTYVKQIVQKYCTVDSVKQKAGIDDLFGTDDIA